MLSKNLRNAFLVIILGIFISACSTTAKKTKTASASASASASAGDVYTGKDTVKYLATGVADRVFFATNSNRLTSAAKSTLDKQAGYLKAAKISVVIEGHADERGTREYNLALGERRANAVRDYLMTKGIAKSSIKILSYGKERPANTDSSKLAWSQNRRSVTIKSK